MGGRVEIETGCNKRTPGPQHIQARITREAGVRFGSQLGFGFLVAALCPCPSRSALNDFTRFSQLTMNDGRVGFSSLGFRV